MKNNKNINYQNTRALLKNKEVLLKYHYNFFGYVKLFAGGTPIPSSVDVLRKLDKKIIKTIKDYKSLDDLADT